MALSPEYIKRWIFSAGVIDNLFILKKIYKNIKNSRYLNGDLSFLMIIRYQKRAAITIRPET
jgi:hypothetical protein